MTEPLHVRIRSTTSTAAALLLICQEIEQMQADMRDLAKSTRLEGGLDWNVVQDDHLSWPKQITPASAYVPVSAPEPTTQQRKIAKLREKIAEETDPDNLRALEATLRLALEEHVRLPGAVVPPSLNDEVIAEGWASLAKTATPEQIAARMQWAKQVGLEQYMRTAEALKMAAEKGGNDVEELYAWFGKVGPRGLFTADHTACLQLPYEARLWLVERMSEEDEVLGRDMGADLLKSTESMDRETAKEMYEPTWTP